MDQTQPASPAITAPIITGLSAIADDYDVVLCDVWGVLHNGQACFEAAVEALTRFRAKGGTVVLITNAPRPNGPVREQMDQIGVSHTAYDDVVTSGDVTIAAIAERGDAPVFHIGPPRDLALFDQVEKLTSRRPSLRPLEGADYVVVTGLFHETADTPETYDPELSLMRDRELTMICANPDLVVHIGTELRYCAGAVAERYRKQGGRVVYAGKPHAPIYNRARELAAKHRGVATPLSRVLAIGDALHTDVAGGVLQGIDVIFVTNGIHRDETHRTGDGQLDPDAYEAMIREAEHRPLAAMAGLSW